MAVKGSQAKSPDVEIQETKNTLFNELLDKIADKKQAWKGREVKVTPRQIVDLSFKKFTEIE